MGWSFRVARVSGIDIKVHATFFLILLLAAWQGGRNGPAGALYGIALMLLLFLCVTLHELGHSVAAQRFGIPVREIVLMPLGGVAFLGENPKKPWHELVIAAAGPLVNVAIALVLALIAGVAVATGALAMDALTLGVGLAPSWSGMLLWLLQANIGLVLFNLIPAFPLDGGRMLRAALAMGLGQARATRIATIIGQLAAVAMGAFAIYTGNLVLGLVALFIYFGASSERSAVNEGPNVLDSIKVGDAYNKNALTLQIGDKVATAAQYILTSYQPDYAVIQGDAPIGIVTREDVFRALADGKQDQYVQLVMQREFTRVAAETTLSEVRSALLVAQRRVAAVFDGDRYLGLVSQEDIAEAFAVLAFRQRGIVK